MRTKFLVLRAALLGFACSTPARGQAALVSALALQGEALSVHAPESATRAASSDVGYAIHDPVLPIAALPAAPGDPSIPQVRTPAGRSSDRPPVAPAAGPPPGEALALPEAVTLDQVLELLRRSSPRSAADRSRVDVAAADTITARLLPNPAFDYGWSHLRHGTNTGSATVNQYTAEQPLLLFGQRAGRRRFAELGVGLAEAQAAEALAEREREVRVRFVSLISRQEKAKALEEAGEDLKRVEHVVAARAEAGDRSRYETLRIEVEARTVQAELEAASADVEDASGSLASLLGFPDWRPHAEGELRASGTGSLDAAALWEHALATRPALVAARREEATARSAAALARRERWPVPVVSAGEAAARDATNTTAVAGLSLPLPLFDRGQGAIARADAEERTARLEAEALEAEAHADLERAIAVLEHRRTALTTVDAEVWDKLPVLRRMAEDAYREGKGDILELLDALRSLNGVRLIRLDHLESVIEAEIDVQFLSGSTDR